jgi:hypothetical protein
VALSRRNRETLEAVTRTLVPSGSAILQGAEELGLVETVRAEVEGYPRRAHRRIRLLLFGIEHYPLLSGRLRRFSRMSPDAQRRFLAWMGRHKRSPLRRLIVSYLKQLVYANYLSQPDVEAAVGYRYECAKPRADVNAAPEEQIHH